VTAQEVATTELGRATPDGDHPYAATHRNRPLDGIRGAAIVLVVLFHSSVVWPAADRRELGSVEALFQAGNVAVSVFFVLSGFLVTQRLLGGRESHRVWGPLVYLERRTLRILLQMSVMLLAVLLLSRFDPTDTASPEATRRSVLAALTFTFNVYVRDHALAARSDIGQLYFLSIDVQYFVVATVVVVLLARWRRALLALAVVALLVTFWWRWHLYLDEGWFRAALTTTARMDGLLAGSAAALALHGRPAPAWLTRNATALAGASVVVLVGAVVSCAWFGIDAYFGWQGIVTTLAATGFVLGTRGGVDPRSHTARVLSVRPLVIAGRVSLSIFLWHMLVFQVVRRHLGDWHPLPKSLVALAALAVLVVLSERLVVPAVDALLRRLFGWRRIARLTGR
jgi:peptidoglycan/LPS O-acetylase OafA/YrhL